MATGRVANIGLRVMLKQGVDSALVDRNIDVAAIGGI
jgi:hypothetical protein